VINLLEICPVSSSSLNIPIWTAAIPMKKAVKEVQSALAFSSAGTLGCVFALEVPKATEFRGYPTEEILETKLRWSRHSLDGIPSAEYPLVPPFCWWAGRRAIPSYEGADHLRAFPLPIDQRIHQAQTPTFAALGVLHGR